MSDDDRVRRVWDRYAASYDRDMGLFDRLWFGGGREWVGAQATGEVLEVAVGTGRNLAYYPAEVRLSGVDLSPAMLGVARRRAADLGREIVLREADAQALPFPDASFDTVVCTLGLCSFPDDAAAIAEMRRVLRPGGRLLLLDHIRSHHTLILAGQRLLERITLRMMGDYLTRRPLPLVERAGFVVDRQERLKLGTVERLAATKPAE